MKTTFPIELFEFLSIPSISTQPEHKVDIYKAAHFLCNYMKQISLDDCRVIETDGHPVVYGEKIIDPELPTVLIYGHYDVQPADPISEWNSPPFQPEVRQTEIHPEGAIFARGACDDKGQLFIPLQAYKKLVDTGNFPCNIKFIFEGEEEIGSPSLPEFIEQNKKLLDADFLLVCDTAMPSKTQPALIYKLKGAGLIDITLTTKNPDLHSGIYGGLTTNAATELCKLITKLEAYFENSLDLATYFPCIPSQSNHNSFTKEIEPKNPLPYHPHIIAQHLPTMEVNGITSGYVGKGHKTVIPNTASAKISVRSSMGEATSTLLYRLTKKLNELEKPGFKLSINSKKLCEAVQTDTDTPEFLNAQNALETTFKKMPFIQGIGGSIPVVDMFKRHLNLNSILMGFGLDSDNIHSPNEHYGLDNFRNGVKTYTTFLQSLPLTFAQKMHEQEISSQLTTRSLRAYK